MRSKRLIAAMTALLCMTAAVSCGKKSSDENSEIDNASSVSEVKEAVPDEKMTKEGNIPAYKVTETKYKEGGETEITIKVCNKFGDSLSEERTGSLAQSVTSEYEYSSDGLLAKSITETSFDIVDSDLSSKDVCVYDSHGEIISFTYFSGEEISTEARYENEYDSKGRLTAATCYSVEDGKEEFSSSISYKYDENGFISEMESYIPLLSRTEITVFERDKNGNNVHEVTSIKKDDEEATPYWEFRYTYNSHDLPETQEEWFRGELSSRTEYEYEFYD